MFILTARGSTLESDSNNLTEQGLIVNSPLNQEGIWWQMQLCHRPACLPHPVEKKHKITSCN